MAYFTKPHTPRGTLAPLSPERIVQALAARGTPCEPDEDGMIAGRWDGCLFSFISAGAQGEVLQVRGVWWGLLAFDRLDEALGACNDWNDRTYFAKAFVHRLSDGLVIAAEHTVDYEHGLTDTQLHLHLTTALGSIGPFFAELDERFPAEAAAAKAEFEAA